MARMMKTEKPGKVAPPMKTGKPMPAKPMAAEKTAPAAASKSARDKRLANVPL